MSKTVYVGNLNSITSREDLMKAFALSGNVESVFLPLDSLGRSKRIGFITFADEDSAERAINDWNQSELDGRTIRVNYSAEPPENL